MSDKSNFKNETLWKLVDAKCTEIKHAISSTRLPTISVLLLAYIWAVSLYNYEFGFTKTIKNKLQKVLVEMKSDTCNSCKILQKNNLKSYQNLLNEDSIYNSFENKMCYEVLKTHHDIILNEQISSWKTYVPGVSLSIWIFDLGIISQVALLILLLWNLASYNRENNAIKGFVDFHEPLKKRFPKDFYLEPKQSFFSSEHYVYAFNAVTNRFLFIIYSNSKTHIIVSSLLIFSPLVVAFWNIYTDFRDFIQLISIEIANILDEYTIRCFITLIVFVFNAILTKKIFNKIHETGILQNGWRLSIKDCWEEKWNENDLQTAPITHVNLELNQASIEK